jgi:predicted lipoprotein with Yx(FWY)xxD motif
MTRLRSKRPGRAGVATLVVLAAVLLAGCGSSTPSAATAPKHHHTTTKTVSGPSVDTAVVSGFGRILVTASGRTLYELSSDSPGKSSCSSACEAAWPPLALSSSTGDGVAGPGAQASCLTGAAGRAVEPSGTYQVAYCGHPLYTFSGDTAAGQVNGFGIHAFGGVWYPVSVSGAPVQHRTSSSSSSTTTSSPSSYY